MTDDTQATTGWPEYITEVVEDAPPLTEAQVVRLRRIFTGTANAQTSPVPPSPKSILFELKREERARKRRRVYFIENPDTGLIKIGFSNDVKRRLKELQTAVPNARIIGHIAGDTDVERDLHSRFGHLRQKGEWFTPEMELLEHIESLFPSPVQPLSNPPHHNRKGTEQ